VTARPGMECSTHAAMSTLPPGTCEERIPKLHPREYSVSTAPHDVQVLMAVQNGDRWLAPQIASILAQENTSCTWAVTDDASSDNSLEIIQNMVSPDRLVLTSLNKKSGLPDVFLNMLHGSRTNHDYYAFADQDDEWSNNKLDRACHALNALPPGQAALWVSSITITSESDHVHREPTKRPTLGNAFVEGLAPGCSMVWNAALHNQLVIPGSNKCKMHDTWMYLSACILGSIIVESDSMVDFRLHTSNAVGNRNDIMSRIRRFFGEIRGARVSMETQAQAFIEAYGSRLSQDELALAQTVATGTRRNRLRALAKGDLARTTLRDNILLALRLLIVLTPQHIDSPPLE